MAAATVCAALAAISADAQITRTTLAPASTTEPALRGPSNPIRVTPLGGTRRDAVGILPSQTTGLPHDLWGVSDSGTIAALLLSHETRALPAATALIQRILLSELAVPRGAGSDGALLLARLDHLLDAGALDQAEALLSRLQNDDRAIFDRRFQVALLTGRADRACAEMLRNPGLSPSVQAQVFCLARGGDWRAASVTLRAASVLGEVEPAQEALLSRFLDPELFEDEPEPPEPPLLDPLSFTMREALALPRSGKRLPLAYLAGDLHGYHGWRNQLIAAERLVRAQSIPPPRLFDIYRSARASASGGVWERVRAIRRLDDALASGDTDRTARALIHAYDTMLMAGLEFALVEPYLGQITDLPLTGRAAQVRFHLALLHRTPERTAPPLAPDTDHARLLVAVITDQPGTGNASTDFEQAVLNALSDSDLESHLFRLIHVDRRGEAVLRALHLLRADTIHDPAALEIAISALIRAGLRDTARAIAVQALILDLDKRG